MCSTQKNGLLFAKKYTTRQFRTTLAVGDNNDNINVGTKKKKKTTLRHDIASLALI